MNDSLLNRFFVDDSKNFPKKLILFVFDVAECTKNYQMFIIEVMFIF